MPVGGNACWPEARGNDPDVAGVTKFIGKINAVTAVTVVTPSACVFVEVGSREVSVSAISYECACRRYHRYPSPLSLSISLKEKEKYRVTAGVTAGVTPRIRRYPTCSHFIPTTPALPPRRVPGTHGHSGRMPEGAAGVLAAPAPASPCVGACGLGDDGHCRGCARAAAEIAAWREMPDAGKRAVLARIAGMGVDAAGGAR